MDNLTPTQRHKNMQNIRSKETIIEMRVRSELRRRGLRFRKNVPNMIGKPDIVFPSSKVAVFLDSCFWHQCPYHANLPLIRRKYWIPKLERNKERAKEVNRQIRKKGWTVLRFWEHQIKNHFDECINKVAKVVKSRETLRKSTSKFVTV